MVYRATFEACGARAEEVGLTAKAWWLRYLSEPSSGGPSLSEFWEFDSLSFFDERRVARFPAAGLLGEHFSWTNAGDIEFFEDTPDLVKDQVRAVYAKHAPSSV